MCPARYFYSYIEKVDRVFSGPAALGNIVHGVLETAYGAGEELTKAETILLFDEQVDKYDPEHLISQEDLYLGLNMAFEYMDRTPIEDFAPAAHDDNLVSLSELAFNVVIGSILLNGYIDHVFVTEKLITIVDFKAQPLETPILTPTGWTKMKDLNVDDYVVGVDGSPTKIVGVYPQGIIPSYRVTFTDGSSTICSTEHLWKVKDLRGKESVLPLNRLDKLKQGKQYKYSIPTVSPVEFASQTEPLPIHPYILGVILGDGGTTGGKIKLHCEDQSILYRVNELLPEDLTVKYDWKKSTRISAATGRRNKLKTALEDMNLMGLRSHEKFVPQRYLLASLEDRLELLKGLMDTDGGCSTRTDFRTSSLFLRDAVMELCRSLGGNPTTSQYEGYRKDGDQKIPGRTCYVVNVRMHENPFSIQRKRQTWKPPIFDNARKIKSIERLEDMPMQCIKVENPDGLYVTENYIVTHNTGKWEVKQNEASSDLQLGIYALVTSFLYPDRKVRAELHYLRSGRAITHTFTDEDLNNVKIRLLEGVTKLIEETNFNITQEYGPCFICDHAKSGLCIKGAQRTKKKKK